MEIARLIAMPFNSAVMHCAPVYLDRNPRWNRRWRVGNTDGIPGGPLGLVALAAWEVARDLPKSPAFKEFLKRIAYDDPFNDIVEDLATTVISKGHPPVLDRITSERMGTFYEFMPPLMSETDLLRTWKLPCVEQFIAEVPTVYGQLLVSGVDRAFCALDQWRELYWKAAA